MSDQSFTRNHIMTLGDTSQGDSSLGYTNNNNTTTLGNVNQVTTTGTTTNGDNETSQGTISNDSYILSQGTITSGSTTTATTTTTTSTNSTTAVTTSEESTLIWKQGTGPMTTGSVLVKLAQNGYTREAHKIIGLSHTASLVGRDSDGGLPELWDVMGKRKGTNGITRLMAMCKTRGSLSAQRASSLIRDHNVDVMEKDDGGCTALFHALHHKYKYDNDYDDNDTNRHLNLDLINVLIKANPNVVKEPNTLGEYPIFFACNLRAPYELIEEMFNLCPEGAIEMIQSNSHFLLHLVASKYSDKKVLKLLAEAYPEGLLIRDYEGNVPHNFKPWGNIENAKFFIDINPDTASVSTRWERCLPLHYACAGEDADIEYIKYLVSVYPEGLSSSTDDGHLPFTIACTTGASFEVMSFLLEMYPDAAHSCTIDTYDYECDKSTMHLVLMSQDISLERVKYIYSVYPEALKRGDRNDKLPLHYCVIGFLGESAPFEVFEFILNSYPEAAMKYSTYQWYEEHKRDKLPLHYAAMSRTPSVDAVCRLLLAYPDAIRERDGSNRLPVQLARSHNAPPEIIELLSVPDLEEEEGEGDEGEGDDRGGGRGDGGVKGEGDDEGEGDGSPS
jgi:hypothetical protein